MTRGVWRRLGVLVAALGLLAAPAARAVPGGASIGSAGVWMTDAAGRVVILHGLNQVYKVAPYTPSAGGFSDDDAAFLAANGFNAMRLGVIWAAVEPRPGAYDDAYLASLSQTVQTLARHGIVSLLDFHQDLYNEEFQGEGAPAWATQDGGLLNPPLGFPGNYFANLAENHAWDAFWGSAPAPDGRGLQDHYVGAVAHVASYFRGVPSVAGYEVMNEPWPGTAWALCLNPLLGCPLFDATLSAFNAKAVSAVRAADSGHLIWTEPNVLFNQGMPTNVTAFGSGTGFAFHDYCGVQSLLGNNLSCPLQDALTFHNAATYSSSRRVPPLLTEFGATNDLSNLTEVENYADQNRMSWLEWAYTGNDKTSSSSSGQALVYDPSQPPVGANVNAAKLQVLARPYPQAVAGVPGAWSWANGVFALTYSTARADGVGSFGAGSETDISAPAVAFPHGYTVSVAGARVTSAPNAATLRLALLPGASTVTVSVRAN
ncbi:hypothetical protein Back2_27870 [Nocardioides baekrokdamisoli]|uniref:Endoglycoceramidase n=1 Tax=Nocardioides baekrokdamisoli TaxID=1804624 RepID=A0A3G9IHF9_9ACTN|nr:cellulase family glycosylhydrolase [Nocardioides baekrokdamisoli]BBH18500.1 hypothetical protein Back2_27870 [Nocardioides baekrokdamisoli]